MPGYRSVLAALCVVALLVLAASATAPAAPGADCSKATATQLVNDNKLNNFILPDPFAQLLCGPFTWPGSTAMAVTIGAATCWSPQSWAVFTFDAGTWRLVHVQPRVGVQRMCRPLWRHAVAGHREEVLGERKQWS